MSDLSNLECDLVAATIKEMLRHRPIERTDDAIWRSAIRFGLVKASIANETMLAGGEATAWCDGAHVAAFGGPHPVPPQNIEVSMGWVSLVERFEKATVAYTWHPSASNKEYAHHARAALLAYGAGVERDAERWRFSLTLLGAQSPADALLNDANQLLRTCYQVAEREHVKPNSTNWPALRDRIHDALKQQHTHMYPDTTRPTEARDA